MDVDAVCFCVAVLGMLFWVAWCEFSDGDDDDAGGVA